MSDIMIDAQQVCKNFGQLQVLKGIDLHVPKGNVTCLLGPSGSGKSTFLRCVNHLEKITAGRLYVDGDLIGYRERNGTLYEISEHEAALQRANIGMVFQQFNLFSHRTVLQNIIEAPTQVKKVPAKEAETRAMELLERVGLAHKADAYPIQLSGGQQQRVAIARALVAQPTVIFADEPTGNLDSVSSSEVLRFLRDSVDVFGQTVIMVTHDPIAATYADETILLADGRITATLVSPTVEQVVAALQEVE